MYGKAVGVGTVGGAGFLPTTGMGIVSYVIIAAALMAVGFALYRLAPKRHRV